MSIERIQHQGGSTTGWTPPSILSRELAVGQADQQIFMGDTTGTARPMLGITQFSVLANYAAGALVVYAGAIYKAVVAVTAGPFNAASWTSISELNGVRPEDFEGVGNGVVDDTAAVQAAATAAGGGALLFSPGKTYKISGVIQLPEAAITIRGYGATVVPVVLSSFTPDTSTGSNLYICFWSHPASLTEGPVIIEGLSFKSPDEARWAGHAITLQNRQDVTVRDVYNSYLDDTVALVGCANTLITGCRSYYAYNCAYDHWDAAQNALVLGNFTFGCGSDVNFNAEKSSTSDTLTATAAIVADNIFVNCTGANVFVAPLALDSNVYKAIIQRNQFKNMGAPVSGNYPQGVTVEQASFVTVSDNIFDGYVGAPIYINASDSSGGHLSTYCSVIDNTILNSTLSTAAFIIACGTHHTIAGNKAYNSTALIAIQVDDPSTFIGQNDLSGWTFAYVANGHTYGGATSPAMQMDVDLVDQQFMFHQPAAVLGTSGGNLKIEGPRVLDGLAGITNSGTGSVTVFGPGGLATYGGGITMSDGSHGTVVFTPPTAANGPVTAQLFGSSGGIVFDLPVHLQAGADDNAGHSVLFASAIPATGGLLGTSGTLGVAGAVSVGSGLALTSGTLVASGIPATGGFLFTTGTEGVAQALAVGANLSVVGSSPGTLEVAPTPTFIEVIVSDGTHGGFTFNPPSATNGDATVSLAGTGRVVFGPSIVSDGNIVANGTMSADGNTVLTTTAIPPSGGILGTTGTAGVAGAITVGAGLKLSGTTLSSVLSAFDGVVTIGANTTLTDAEFGSFLIATAACTITTPAPADLTSGLFVLWNNAGASVTLSTPSGGFYGPAGSNSSTLTVAIGVVLRIVSIGSIWCVFS